MKTNPHCHSAFTIIELLIVFSIIAVLAGLVSMVAGQVKQNAMSAQEVAAAKNLVTGLHLYATDNANRLMPGVDRTVHTVELPNGEVIGGEPAFRYPWRLAPYVGNTADGTFVLDVNKRSLPHPDPDNEKNIYHVSVGPALGYNGYILGGFVHSAGDGTQKRRYAEHEVVTRANDSTAMSLIAFASAHSKRYASDKGMKGNFLVSPPGASLPGISPWFSSQWADDIISKRFGHVDLRYGERAVVARLDGSIEMLDQEQLKDMRNWSAIALEEDNPDHTLSFR